VFNDAAVTARSTVTVAGTTSRTIAVALTAQINTVQQSAVDTVKNVFSLVQNELNNELNHAKNALSGNAAALSAFKAISEFATTLDKAITDLLSKLNTVEMDVWVNARNLLQNASNELTQTVNSISAIGVDAIQTIAGQFCGVLSDVVDATSTDTKPVIDAIKTQLKDFETAAHNAIDAAKDLADQLVDALGDDVSAAVDQFTQAFVAQTSGLAQQTADIAGDLQTGLAEGLGRVADAPTFQDPESTLNLIRAAGQSPLLPNFTFNRDRIAYVYDDFQEAVRTSPIVGLVNRVGDDLKALGLRVPTEGLMDRLVPASLQNFDISQIFPDLSGFKLGGLFSGVKLPQIAQDNVIVTHGFDRASQSAWVKASSNVPLPNAVDVFNFGPLKLSILSGNFTAQEDVIATIQGPPRSTANAEIVGDWQLGFSGIDLVTFEQTRIAYDGTSGLTVDISPQRIRMDASIQFLSDMIKALSDPSSGLVLELDRDPISGNPIGARAGLDLPLPPVAAGAFAASGIRLAASTALTVVGGFSVEVAAALGRPDEPFTLLIAFLNGGGYLTASSKYTPGKDPPIVAQVAVAIVAGVGADFTFGVARGSVYIQVGAQAAFMTPGSGLSLEVFLLVRGGVSILSLISINLVLRLGITYNSNDGSVDASGHISVSIKISIFFTLNVDVPVHYHLAGRSKTVAEMFAAGVAAAAITGRAAAWLQSPPVSEPPSRYLDLFA
jgi:hypothetical protein